MVQAHALSDGSETLYSLLQSRLQPWETVGRGVYRSMGGARGFRESIEVNALRARTYAKSSDKFPEARSRSESFIEACIEEYQRL